MGLTGQRCSLCDAALVCFSLLRPAPRTAGRVLDFTALPQRRLPGWAREGKRQIECAVKRWRLTVTLADTGG